MTSCGIFNKQFVQPTSRDPLFCPPTAMTYCDQIEEPTNEARPKTFAKGLVIDYGVCAFKHRVVVDCVRKYESKAIPPS